MSCPLPVPNWWQAYAMGRLRSPQSIYRAALSEKPDNAKMSERMFDIPEPVGFDAPERLKAPLHFKTETYMRQIRRANWLHADPRLIVWAAVFQCMAQRRQIPLYVHSCLRTEAEQNDLVRRGVSKAKYPTSAHNIGEAVDIVHGVFHWEMNRQEWHLLHVLGRLALDRVNATLKKADKLELEWGGSWRFYDPAHWEIHDFRNRRRRLPASTSKIEWTPKNALAARETLLAGL